MPARRPKAAGSETEGGTMIEVEQKYPVDDLQRVADVLVQLGAEQVAEIEQQDVYFAHPCRDFAETDEAFRIRTTGEQTLVTYKGPKLDQETKTRREIEMPLCDDPASSEQCEQILLALGFRRVAAVQKSRRAFRLLHAGTPVEAVLDKVTGVGRYVELEVMCPGTDDATASDDQLHVARTVLRQLATKLDLSKIERRSYLELLLAGQESSSTPQG